MAAQVRMVARSIGVEVEVQKVPVVRGILDVAVDVDRGMRTVALDPPS